MTSVCDSCASRNFLEQDPIQTYCSALTSSPLPWQDVSAWQTLVSVSPREPKVFSKHYMPKVPGNKRAQSRSDQNTALECKVRQIQQCSSFWKIRKAGNDPLLKSDAVRWKLGSVHCQSPRDCSDMPRRMFSWHGVRPRVSGSQTTCSIWLIAHCKWLHPRSSREATASCSM